MLWVYMLVQNKLFLALYCFAKTMPRGVPSPSYQSEMLLVWFTATRCSSFCEIGIVQ